MALALTGLWGSSAFAELRISEICPKPTGLDPNGKASGWIELWNDGDAAVDLADYELVRANRGKALAPKGKPLASRTVPAGGYTVVYTSEEYDNADLGEVTVYDNDVMVCPFKVSPKKYPLVALYKGSELLEQFIVPVDLPDNQSIAPAGGGFPYYGGESVRPDESIEVDATPISLGSGALTIDSDSGVTLSNGVYDFAAVTAKQKGLKVASSVTAQLCAESTWSAKFSFKLHNKTATSQETGYPLFFCRQSGATPKSGIIVYVNNAGSIRIEFRDTNGTNNKKFDVDSENDWYDNAWHTVEFVSTGNFAGRFALAVDGVTYLDTDYSNGAPLVSTLPICFGHAYDSNTWDLFDGAIKDISFYKGTLIGRDAVQTGAGTAVLQDLDAKVSINTPAAVSRVILQTVTKGEANNRVGEVAYGPNAGPLYGISHGTSDWKPCPPAKPGQNYPVTMAVNPMSDASRDAISAVTLIYRADFGNTASVAMTKGAVDADEGQLWTAEIPASALPAAGHLVRWAAQVTDASGNIWRTPSFRDADNGYEWYGTIVEPTSDQVSATLQTWHMFADSTATSKMDYQYASVRGSLPLGARVGIYDSQTSNYYDNVRIDLRGNTTGNMKKKSHGLRFPKAQPMTCVNPFDGEKIKCRKTSLIAEFADPSRVRSSLSMKLRRMAGQDVPFGYPLRVQLNGAFYQLDHHTNRFTDELLEDYFGYDPYGYAFKNVGTVGGDNTGGGMNQVLPDDGTSVTTAYNSFATAVKDAAAYTYSATGLSATQSNNVNKAVAKLYDMPAWINFLALSRFTQECDDGWANLCLYYDRLGNGTWRPMAYDLHQSFGAYYYKDNYWSTRAAWATEDQYGKCHPFYGGMHVVTYNYRDTPGKGNRAYEAVYQNAKYRRMIVRRLRTIMDQILKEPGTSKADTPFWNDYVEPMVAAMRADDVLDRNKWGIGTGTTIYVWPSALTFEQGITDLWDNYFVKRRTHFYNTHSITNTAFAGGYAWDKNAEIPLAQSATSALAAQFSVEAVPGGAVLRNLNEETVDLSGWKLSGAMNYTFPAGAVIDRAFGTAAGEIIIVSNRIAYVTANESTLTDQVILGNAKVGSGAAYELMDAAGELVIGTPEPEETVLSGDYDSLVTLETAGKYVLDHANFKAGLAVADGITVKLSASSNTVNTISSLDAANAEVRFTGDGTVKLQGADTLATVSNLVVKAGVLQVKSTGVAATKTPVVNVLGFVEQTGGTIAIDLDVSTTNQIYGIYLASKDPKGPDGKALGLVYAKFDGGAITATVGGTRSSAVYVDKGSVTATFKGGQTVDAVLKGPVPRFISAAGDIEFKRCEVNVSMASPSDAFTGARAFKSDKKISITDGRYVANLPGPDAEVFSAGDKITIDDGTFELVSSDDCFSAMSRITVNGGLFYVVSTADDVFDSNGDMEINGGTILAYTAAEGHEAFDVDPEQTEEGGSLHQLRINGGTIFATGGKGSDWPDDTAVADGVSVFSAEDLDAGAYSGKYMSLSSLSGVKTTAKLPVFRQSKCAILATCPLMRGSPELSSTAPTEGGQDFHDLYVETLVLANQEELRFLEIYGATLTNAVETTGDVGEYIVLTNISDKVVQLAGLKVNVEKLADWDKSGESASKCLFILTEGSVAPHGTVRLDQATYWSGSKQKITNGEIHIELTDSTGQTVQYGKASFDGTKYPEVDCGGASLIAIRFETQMKDNTEYWKSSAGPVAPDPGDLGSFRHAVTYTVSGYTGTAALDRFPVLVRLSANSPEGFAYSMLESDASDLRFADAELNPLPFEVEKWNPSGESLVWVSLPTMSNGTTFTMYFGGTPSVENDPKDVWTDYVGVWHMSEASGTVKDSTGNGLDAVPAGSAASASVAVDGGPVGSARQFASSQGKGLTYLLVPDYDSFGLADKFTIQGWFKASACATSYSARYVSRKTDYRDNNGWEFEQRYGEPDVAAMTVSCRGASSGDFTQTVPDIRNAWLDLAVNYSGKSVQYYVNGSVGPAVTITAAATDNGKQLSIGCNPEGTESNWMGQMDEIRLRKGDVTADRMLAEHETIADLSFLSATAVMDVKDESWDVPGGTGGINGFDDGHGRKFVRFTSLSLVDGKLTLGLAAAKVDADGERFLLLCKESLTDAQMFPLQVTLKNGAEESLGTLEGLTNKPQLFILGIGPAE